MDKVYILKQRHWDDEYDGRVGCLVYSTLDKALQKLQDKKQEVIKSWETSNDHIIDGVVTDRIVEYDNGFDVEELHYFFFKERDWEFEYGYNVKEYSFEVVKEAYKQCNCIKDDYIDDLTTIVDTDKGIICDFDLG